MKMKLNYGRTFFIGLAFLSICSFWQLYDSIIPLILTNTFHLGESVSGVVMALDNILALFMLPLFGALSDRVKSPLGKRMPFIVFGTAAAVIAMLCVVWADRLESLPFFIAALLITLVSMGTYRAPAVALMPSVTPKPLRSKANAVINLMGAVGGVISLGLIRLLVKEAAKPDYLPLFACVAVLMVVSVVILTATTRENKLCAEMQRLYADSDPEPQAEPGAKPAPLPKPVFRSLILILVSVSLWFMGYNAVTTWFSKYAQTYWNMPGGNFATTLMIATVSAVATYIPAGMIATKIGRKKTILGGVALLTATFAAGAFIRSYTPVINLLFVVTGIGWAAINVNSYPMVVEMARGSTVGKYTGYYYTFSMAAQTVTPIIAGTLLENVGYATLFPYAAVFAGLSFVTMLFVKHGDSRPEAAKDKMEYLNADD